MIAAKLADRERTDTLKRGASRSSKTSDGKISEPEAAKMMKVGRTGVQAAKKVLREAPEKATAIATGKLTVGKAVRELKPKKPKKETPFEDKVWLKWSAWLKKWPPSQLPQVKRLVHEWSGEGRLAA
jgi:hypothetical protein